MGFIALPAFWWAITGLFSVISIWLFKKPAEGAGFFGSIPMIGWVVAALVLIIIIRSRR